jgi:hypothetical protein
MGGLPGMLKVKTIVSACFIVSALSFSPAFAVEGKVEYWYDGRIKSVGGEKVEYRYDGQIKSIGGEKVEYRYDGQIKSVGGKKVEYWYDGRLKSIEK